MSSGPAAAAAAAVVVSSGPVVVAPSSDVTPAQQELVLTEINTFRALHGAEPLTVDPALSADAQAYADKCVYDYQPQLPYGQALGASDGTLVDAVLRWESEAVGYDYTNEDFDPKAGEFTQLVWKASKRIGMGAASCQSEDFGAYTLLYVVFDPPGNFLGEFVENVGRPLS
ncbi:CAP family protein [Streptomyces sp. NPDC051567]|uniref:CAP family protein n=1 Tax=Streptomyces sp. NPDC051567 TaxID=3365660 RepID=UPI0037B837E3